MVPLALLVTGAVALSAPLLASLGDIDLLVSTLGELDLHAVETETGYAALFLTLLALISSLAPRRIRGLYALRRSAALHIVTGMAILATVVVHTQGAWGKNLNAMLSASLLAVVFIPLIGKLVENRSMARDPRKAARVRALWLPAHLFAVSLFVVLLLFHVFSLYYF